MGFTIANIETKIFDALRTVMECAQVSIKFASDGTAIEALQAAQGTGDVVQLQGVDPGYDGTVYFKASDLPGTGFPSNNVFWIGSDQFRIVSKLLKGRAVYAMQYRSKWGNG